MLRMRLLLLATVILWTGSTVWAQTTLTAKPGTPDLDGVFEQGEWASEALLMSSGATLHAMADGEYLYLAARWPDDTENIDKSTWEFDGSAWVKGPGNEDRFRRYLGYGAERRGRSLMHYYVPRRR